MCGQDTKRSPFSIYVKGARLPSCFMGPNMITQAVRPRSQFKRYVTSKINKNSLKYQTNSIFHLCFTLFSHPRLIKRSFFRSRLLCVHFPQIWYSYEQCGLFIFQHQVGKMTSFIYSLHPLTCLLSNTSFQRTHLGLHTASCLACAFFYGTQFKGREL